MRGANINIREMERMQQKGGYDLTGQIIIISTNVSFWKDLIEEEKTQTKQRIASQKFKDYVTNED